MEVLIHQMCTIIIHDVRFIESCSGRINDSPLKVDPRTCID